jgi:hypothetical protein
MGGFRRAAPVDIPSGRRILHRRLRDPVHPPEKLNSESLYAVQQFQLQKKYWFNLKTTKLF